MGKRLFDILFSVLVLTILSPAFIFLALLIRLTSKGPALFSCKRVGQNGKTIYCYKFRTMVYDAQERLKELLKTNPGMQKEWNQYRKIKRDPRITFIGNLLRKTSLDELPQFYNVLKGDLSVVGPRPVTEEEVRTYYQDNASVILSVRPGITGLWQVSGRNARTLEERVRLEQHYVLEGTFFTDLGIIVRTIPAMLLREGL